jgi:hypothetical protein
MTQKKFLQIIGIFFTLQLIDSTSSAYGMIPGDQEDQPPRSPIRDRHVFENESERAIAMQNFEALVICQYEGDPHIDGQHEGRPLIVRNIREFRVEDNFGEPVPELEKFSCQQCWENYMDALGHQLVMNNPLDDH